MMAQVEVLQPQKEKKIAIVTKINNDNNRTNASSHRPQRSTTTTIEQTNHIIAQVSDPNTIW